jgi:transcriptional regulator with XRE-family HTH domain
VSSVHSPAYREFLRRLRDARERAGLTQVQVAAALGRHQSYVSKSESGERRVDVIDLAEFAALYRLPVSAFVPHRTRLRTR